MTPVQLRLRARARELVLEFGNETHGLLHAGLHGPAEGKIFFAAQRTEPVVEAVESEQQRIADIAEVGEDDHVLDDAVEDIAVQHEVAAARVSST